MSASIACALGRLKDYLGREAVVIAWFPRGLQPGGGRVPIARYEGWRPLAVQREILLASLGARETNRAFAESLGMDYPIFGDPTTTGARARGVVGVLGASGLASRSKFCIGADGHILDIEGR